MIAGNSVKKYFVKSNLKIVMKHIIELGNCIAKTLDLNINLEACVIECDARDGLVSYVFDKKIMDIDSDRKIL